MDYLRSKVVSTSHKSPKRKKSKESQNVESDDSEDEERDRESADDESDNDDDKDVTDDNISDGHDSGDDSEEEEEEEEGNDDTNARKNKSKASAACGTIKMRGLPFKVKERHIKDFFAPLRILDIRMIKNNKGKPTGCAFVDFASENDITEALKRDRDCIEGRYIELFRDKEQQSNQKTAKEKPWMKKLAGQGDNEEFESIAEVSFRDLIVFA